MGSNLITLETFKKANSQGCGKELGAILSRLYLQANCWSHMLGQASPAICPGVHPSSPLVCDLLDQHPRRPCPLLALSTKPGAHEGFGI